MVNNVYRQTLMISDTYCDEALRAGKKSRGVRVYAAGLGGTLVRGGESCSGTCRQQFYP